MTRYEPWVLVNRVSRDLERLLNANGDSADDSRSSVVEWVPAVDIKEEETQFVLRADLPGVEPGDIEITMEKGLLTIRGRRQAETRDEQHGFRRVERVTGEFFRRFSLPDTRRFAVDQGEARERRARGEHPEAGAGPAPAHRSRDTLRSSGRPGRPRPAGGTFRPPALP